MAEEAGTRRTTPILAVDGLTIESFGRRGRMPILTDVSFEIAPGEAYGLVGESGCGKSTVALAAMRYLPTGLRIARGQVRIEGSDIAALSDAEIRRLRGRRVAMVYQDPMSSLNPVMRIGRQLMEVAQLHGVAEAQVARERALAMLDEVRLPDPAAMMERYPHQLSGGQQQRAVIAMALMAEPALLVMDEPTTGLDVTIEAAILELVADLRRRRGTAILFISHNLGTVARICDRLGVLYAGRLVETGSIRSLFKRPAHPYTVGLFEALPVLDGARGHQRLRPIEGTLVAADRLRPGCAFEPRCAYAERGTCSDRPIAQQPAPRALEAGHEVRCARVARVAELREQASTRVSATEDSNGGPGQSAALHDVVLAVEGLSKRFRLGRGPGGKQIEVHALSDASLSVERRRTLAIVGESGSGKSTLAKILSGLIPASSGSARLGRTEIATVPVDRRPPDVRRRVQMVFQNPDATLNPSHSIEYALSRPLRVLRGLGAAAARAEARTLLGRVRLPADLAQRLPHQLSGGQRQRVAIARALAGSPELVIADEPVSALDVSVQAAIINLLEDLLKSSDMALVVISHDLAVVRHMADWVAVMYAGHVVQYGPAAEVFGGPHHPYTAALLAAAPRPDVDSGPPPVVLAGSAPSAASAQTGCPFASRCPSRIGPICEAERPPQRVHGQIRIACHLQFPAHTVHSSASTTAP